MKTFNKIRFGTSTHETFYEISRDYKNTMELYLEVKGYFFVVANLG